MTSPAGGDWRARAEARRRRVLEGGAARLAAISGREPPAEHFCAATPLSALFDDAEELVAPYENHYEAPFATETVEPREEPHCVAEQNLVRKPSTFLDKLFETRLHVVLYSCFVYILFATNDIEDTYIFVPLLMWESVELFYFHAQEKKDDFRTGGMLVLHVVQLVLNKSTLILKDACVYIFTIIIFNILVTEFGSFR